MLNISVNRDTETNEIVNMVSYNCNSYDLFSKQKDYLSKIIESTALLMIEDPHNKTFKSLELHALDEKEASITYNSDRTIYIKYNDRNKQFEMKGLGIAISPQYLRIAFLSEAIVEISPLCQQQN